MPLPELWSTNQRRMVLGFIVVLLAYLAVKYWREPVPVSDPQLAPGIRADELADKLNPNTADASALSAIPSLGEKRAAEIIEYREIFLRAHPGQTPFTEARDLLKLKNFGVSTLKNVEPYLIFSPRFPTTSPVR